jgi:hypothetical protein
MSNSLMVVVNKYELQVRLAGGKYQEDGQKKLLQEGKVVPREWVEYRNSQNNNELYVIDEEATAELEKQRELNIKEAQAKAAKDNVSQADLVDALVNLAKGNGEKEEKAPSKRGRKPKQESTEE